jgi:hypothetical protein
MYKREGDLWSNIAIIMFAAFAAGERKTNKP